MVNKPEKREGKILDLTKSKKIEDKPNDKILPKKHEKEEKTAGDKTRALIIIMIIIGLILFLIGLFLLFLKVSYYFYQNLPGDIQNPNSSIDTLPQLKNYTIDGVRQFYPNMKFNHNDISYKIEDACDIEKKLRIVTAFDNISASVEVLQFHQTSGDSPDISVFCSVGEYPTPSEFTDFFIAGEGGAKEVIQTGRYNIISNGAVYLYTGLHNSPICSWPNVEIHEIIHVLGFNHSRNQASLMYPILESCSQKLDIGIIRELNRLYSEPNLPDLYFENVSASKKGRYLDFNITIKNSGVIDALAVSFSVLDNKEVIETKNIKDLKAGAGIVMEVKNFKLNARDSNKIDIVLDYFNKTRELDENNNIAKIRF